MKKSIKVIIFFLSFTILGKILHNHLFLFGLSLILAGAWVNLYDSEQWE